MVPMATGKTHLKTWVDATTRERFVVAAHAQSLSESALLKRLVEQMLSVPGIELTVANDSSYYPRDARVSLRLKAADRLLLQERAAARAMPAATYVSTLVSGHLKALTPLPTAELRELRKLTNELGVIGRNVNQLARIAHQQGTPAVPRRADLLAFFKVCEALRLQVKALLGANTESWSTGARHADR